ncbi:helix-turn-helix transcriptional regulator [Empedobacter falsenii]|uniref:Helix-turn-helix domain-containing protein n=1 Tax=Empedobacter falsenii TaxID=343874 RepID=A0ABY8V7U6_9FLAO|nr:helix-turn-helix transcriptional regulator [Empedobacter falsenii]MDM1061810.1 helix-turn-helix transcriptional regulator [Empedobacter falsenii]WIH97397.1 helix-turn-helix domain-containing protein [Empedobacter falsenii]
MTLLIIEQIKERRKVLAISQETLSDISGVGLRTLKQFESGKGNPTLETLQKLCDALGLEIKLEVKTIES